MAHQSLQRGASEEGPITELTLHTNSLIPILLSSSLTHSLTQPTSQSGRLPSQQPQPHMPIPRPFNLPRQVRQRAVASTNVPVDGVLYEEETLVAPGRLIEQRGERSVALFRLVPHAEVVHEFLGGSGCELDFLLCSLGRVWG